MEVKSESEVAQSCPTLSDPMDCSLPGSSIHGIFQARVLEWGCHCLLRIVNLVNLKLKPQTQLLFIKENSSLVSLNDTEDYTMT